MSADGGTKAIIAALGANLGIAVTKFVAFAFTGSASMLAEGVHSVADSGNQVLLLLGGKRRAAGRDREHPFGYGRERYFYAFIVAVVLFTRRRRCSRCTRACTRSAHPHERRGPGRGRSCVLVVAIVPGGLLVPHRDQGVQRGPRPAQLGGVHPHAPRRPSCPSCCWRTSPR